MLSKKLISLLETFSKPELNRFKKFVNSPFYNENEDLTKLFSIIHKVLRRENQSQSTSVQQLSKDYVWRILYENRPYDDITLRRLCSDLTQLAHKYLAVVTFHSNPANEEVMLLESLNDLKLDKHFFGVVRQSEKRREKSDLKDSNFHYSRFRMEKACHTNSELKKQVQSFDNLERANYHLECFYLSQKLKHICDALEYRKFYSVETTIDVPEDFLVKVPQQPYFQETAVQAYYLVSQMLLHPEEECHFKELKQLLKEKHKTFLQIELNSLYIYLINYCIDAQINNGRAAYFHELFEIFKTTLEQEIILIKGVLDFHVYKNIITVGLRVKQFEWVETFIQEYTKKLPKENQENALTYNLAKVYYEQKEYEKVIAQLREVEYKNLVYALGSKLILLRTYYELKEYLALDSLIDSFRIYLHRNKMISKEVKQQYMNVVRFVKKLANINEFDQKAVQKLKEQVINRKNFVAQRWIVEKIEELEK